MDVKAKVALFTADRQSPSCEEKGKVKKQTIIKILDKHILQQGLTTVTQNQVKKDSATKTAWCKL